MSRYKAGQEVVELAEIALKEMAPLEAGYFLREFGINFPTTMDAITKAVKKLHIQIKSLELKEAKSIFTPTEIQNATKLQIVLQNSKPIRYCLRGDLNKLVASKEIK